MLAHNVLLSSSLILLNAAIALVRYIGGPIADGGPMFFRQKVAVDFLLDERMVPEKFRCICSYRIQMHEEQTNKQTFFFIYIDTIIYIISK